MNEKKSNPVGWFEIPVKDIERAKNFYEKMLGLELNLQEVMGMKMAWFPMQDDVTGASGSLVEGKGYVPASSGGVLVYFSVVDIDAAAERVVANGGKVVVPKTDLGEYGWMVHFEDTEGNRAALHRMK